MTLLLLEGFDSLTSDEWLSLRYTAGGADVSSSTGRFGGTAMASSANTGSTLLTTVASSVFSEIIVGFAVKLSAAPSASGKFGVTITRAGVAQLTLRLVESGTEEWVLELRRGGASGTVIETQTASAQHVGRWYYVEIKAVIDTTTGEYAVNVDGTEVMSDTGLDTAGSGSDDADGVQWRLSTSGLMDDAYVCDTAGTANNDFLGSIACETLLPNAAGNQSDWTPSTGGSNYTCVDEDGTGSLGSDRVTSSTIGHVDLYNYGALTRIIGSPTFIGVQVESVMSMATSGTRDVQHRIRSGGSESTGTAFTVSGGAQGLHSEVFEENPVSTSAWTVSSLNAVEIGVEVAA